MPAGYSANPSSTTAALIYCPFRALLHLPTWADRRRTFERVAASLRPQGRFAWNVWVPESRSWVLSCEFAPAVLSGAMIGT